MRALMFSLIALSLVVVPRATSGTVLIRAAIAKTVDLNTLDLDGDGFGCESNQMRTMTWKDRPRR